MDIRELLARLTVSHGPNENGEYMCKCPAHEDRTASLSVRESDGGKILMHCMAGCSTGDVVRAMGIKMADLFPAGSSKKGERKARQAAPKQGEQSGQSAPAKPKRKPLGKMTKVYSYTDENWNALCEVFRFDYEEEGQGEKTFL